MLCPSCGAYLEDNVKICPNCGHAAKQDWKQGLYTTKINYDIKKITSRRSKRRYIPASENDKAISESSSEPSAANTSETSCTTVANADISQNTTELSEQKATETPEAKDEVNKRKLSGFKKGLLITIASILIIAVLTAFGYFSNKLVLSNFKSWDEMINIFLGLK